jgi:chromate transporter
VGNYRAVIELIGRPSLIDIPTILIAAVTLAILFKFKKKVPEPAIVLAAAVIGLVLKSS